jgi:hypothetical protein
MINKLEDLRLRAMESVIVIGALVKERSKDEFDQHYIGEQVDDINEQICMLVDMVDE